MINIRPVIMAGGVGTRLWPLSRKSLPKQFQKFFSKKSLFQQTILRLSSTKKINILKPIILTNEKYRFIIRDQLNEINIKPEYIIIEPSSKNTSSPILVSSLIEKNPNTLLLMLPSDHVVDNLKNFISDIELSTKTVLKKNLVIYGVKPNRIETGYGYIELRKRVDKSIYSVEKFIEKPDYKNASILYKNKNFLWNSGIILFDPAHMIKLFKEYNFQNFSYVNESIKNGYNDLIYFRLNAADWNKCENISIDYSILEKVKDLFVIKSSFYWNDLGSWESVWQENKKDKKGVVFSNNVTSLDCSDSLLYCENNSQELVALGLDKAIVIAMDDAVLVANREKSQDVRKAVQILKLKNKFQSEQHNKDFRPWGNFVSIAKGDNFQVKIIEVLPGEGLSLQEHKFRSENWVVVKGTAKVTVNNVKKKITVGEAIFIPLNAIHRLENEENTNLIIVEVQTGTYLGEDDIVRHEDRYKRK